MPEDRACPSAWLLCKSQGCACANPMHKGVMGFCRAFALVCRQDQDCLCAMVSCTHTSRDTPGHAQGHTQQQGIKSKPGREWTCRPWNFSQPICTEKSQMRMVRQASIAARAAPLRLFVTLSPKKLKKAMLTMLPSVDACQSNKIEYSKLGGRKQQLRASVVYKQHIKMHADYLHTKSGYLHYQKHDFQYGQYILPRTQVLDF